MEYVMIDGTIVNVHRHGQGAKEGLKDRKALICISQRPQRKEPLRIDLELYKARHLIENFLGKLKEFKRIAMRSDKTDESFKAMIYACSVIINAR
ncbi:MAG: transposase [Cohaesibacter sp.]|nr:transposase [Cohaesibacter sp.]